MRFPPSPQFLMNAAAMGASAGRGRVRGALPRAPAGHGRRAGEPDQQHRGEQPPGSPGFHQHVQPPAELQPGRHQRGKWASMSPEQQAALQAAVDKAVLEVPGCVEEFETTTLDGLAGQQHDRDRRGRRSRGVPDQGRGLPPRQLHAGAGPGPGGHPLDGPVARSGARGRRPRAPLAHRTHRHR